MGHLPIGVQNPFSMIHMCCSHAEGFAKLMRNTLSRVQPPWSIVIYADGITPQDPLSKTDERKIDTVYWSFLEFADALCHEEVWLVLTCARTTELKKIDGGLSRIVAQLLRDFFFNENGNNFAGAGMKLNLLGDVEGVQQMPLTANLAAVLADEPALHDLLLCKGHAGFKPCVLCQNVVLRRYFDPCKHGGFAVPHSCTDDSRFVLHSDASIRASYRRLHSMKNEISETEFAELEKVHGWNYSAWGLVHEPFVHASSQVMFDWMHLYLQSGLIDVEFGQLMRALYDAGSPVTWAILNSYMSKWTWPKAVTSPKTEVLFCQSAAKVVWQPAGGFCQPSFLVLMGFHGFQWVFVVATLRPLKTP